MKHLFWIVCGAVLVALIACWVLLVPTEDARQSKQNLDRQAKDLNKLVERAERGSPQGVFDPEIAADTQRLADEYLITEQWKGVLQPLVGKYEKQLTDIKTQLVGRNAWLARPVAPTKNVLEWYNEYVTASEALLARLREADCFRRAAENEEKSASGESPAAIRLIAGLYTKSGTFPEPREHPQLTARLRAMELIADRLIAGRIAIADSPVVGPTGRSDDRARAAAVIAAVEWIAGGAASEGDAGLRPVSSVLGGQVQPRALGLRLTLDGPLSALLAAAAALERNAEADRPLVAVTTAQLTRREGGLPGDRFDVADDAARLVLTVELIEFAEPGAGAAGAAGADAPPGGPPAGFAPPPGFLGGN